MATGLGPGSGVALRQTVRNNSTTVDIEKGAVVEIVNNAIGVLGTGDAILLGVQTAAAPSVKAIGVAEQLIRKGSAAGEGEWGHTVMLGVVEALAGAAVAAGDALAVQVATGRLIRATAAQVAANDAVGVALTAAGANGDIFTAFVNFMNKGNTGSGYGGTAP